MARRVIGGQVPESPGTLVQQTRDFDSPAKQIDDHNANYEELFALIGAAGSTAFVELPLTAATYNDLDNSGTDFTGVSDIDFIPSLSGGVTVTGIAAGTDGQRIFGFNGGTVDLLFSVGTDGAGDTGSIVANRIRGPSGYIFTFGPGESFWLVYKALSINRWSVK